MDATKTLIYIVIQMYIVYGSMVNMLTSQVPKSVQSQGLRELPKHK